MRPDKEKIIQLEELRKEFNIPHNMLADRIVSSRHTTRKVQKHILEDYRTQMPDASERELWTLVL